MLLNILLAILVLDCVALTGVILLQRSEGGALGMGGGPSGMFTARGAGDLLSRTTAVLATVFFVLSLGITLLAGHNRTGESVTEHIKVNPLDLQALAKGQAAPSASSAPTAPPLPNAAPPLPNQAPAPALPAQLPTQAPRPTLRPAVRPVAPAAIPQVGVRLPTLPQTGPRPSIVPRPNLNAPVPAETAPAAPAPAAPPPSQQGPATP